MASKKMQPETNRLDRIVAEARRNREQRERGYREQALKIYPWVCALCGREFTRKSLHQLTVHHKDHDHNNNPPDGSNWELLCLYCHDNEHSRYQDAEWYAEEVPGSETQPETTHRPFTDLEALLKGKK